MLLEVHQKGVAARLMAVAAVFALALGFVCAGARLAYAGDNPAPTAVMISDVKLSELDEPEIGAMPDQSAHLAIFFSNDTIYIGETTTEEVVKPNPLAEDDQKPTWRKDGIAMPENEAFLAGHTYQVGAQLYRYINSEYQPGGVNKESATSYVNNVQKGTPTASVGSGYYWFIGMTAEWTLYGITYEPNGGTGEAKTQTVYDKTTTLPTNSEFTQFTRGGYTFAGWSTTKEGKVEYADGASYTFPEDTATVTLYAQWVPATYKVTVTPDPAKGGTAIADKQEATAGETVTLSATPAEGYEFVEWKTANAGVTIADGKFTMPGSDVEVTAIFKEKPAPVTTCSVSFKANGGSGTMDSVTGEKDSTVKLPANKFTRTGYTFTGWNTDKDGKGTSYADKASLKLDSDITLYAQWKKNATTTSKSSGTGTLANTSDPTSIASLAVSASAAAAAFGARAFTRRKTH